MHKSCAHPLNTAEGKLGGHGQHDSLAPPFHSVWRRPRMKARWLAFKAPNLLLLLLLYNCGIFSSWDVLGGRRRCWSRCSKMHSISAAIIFMKNIFFRMWKKMRIEMFYWDFWIYQLCLESIQVQKEKLKKLKGNQKLKIRKRDKNAPQSTCKSVRL